MHTLVVGTTMSGKTTLVRQMAHQARHSSTPIESIVYDPTSPVNGKNANGWTGNVYNDFERFASVVWASRNCLVVIDEAIEIFNRKEHRDEAIPMLTRGRHVIGDTGGHACVLIGQRHKVLDKTARNQCATVFAFRVDQDDADSLAAEYTEPGLRQASRLGRFQYLYYRRFGPTPALGTTKG